MIDRRGFLSSFAGIAGVAGAAGLAPKWAAALEQEAPKLPDRALYDSNEEAYWTEMRKQFVIPADEVYLNNGTVGSCPLPVLRAVFDGYNDTEKMAQNDPEDYPIWGYGAWNEFRDPLAEFVGCTRDEFALVRNATEANSYIANGLDLKPGDEVLMTDQEHPSGRSGWLMRQARYGISVREVKIPLPPKNSGQLADLMISSIGPQTRVLSFSAITSPTGLVMPVREICEAARAKGVVTLVDGAHVHGQIRMPISELGCDYFAGSPHKWMFAPAGCGFLYIREENLDRLWPHTVTAGWDDRNIKAARFQMMGTNNRAIFEGLSAGIKFANQIGPGRIYARIHQLARMVYDKARQVPYLELLTPEDDRMYGSLVTFRFTKKPDAFFESCKKQRIWTTGSPTLRVSTHIHTRPSDIDLLFQTMHDTLG